MTTFRISGVWKNNNIITDYAIHEVTPTGTTRAKKTTKAKAITLLEEIGNNATTWLWNYTRSSWEVGEKVSVSSRNGEKYLRTNPDDTERDNLDHLIDYDWVRS